MYGSVVPGDAPLVFDCVPDRRVPGLPEPGLQKIWLGLFIVEHRSSCETAVIKS